MNRACLIKKGMDYNFVARWRSLSSLCFKVKARDLYPRTKNTSELIYGKGTYHIFILKESINLLKNELGAPIHCLLQNWKLILIALVISLA